MSGKTILSKPQVEFVQGQLLKLEAIIKPGVYDADEALRRTRCVLNVLRQTIETALRVDDMRGYEFGMFD